MKSKIFSLFIATLILWGSTTEPMGRFFRYKSPAFSKVMTGLQWTAVGGLTIAGSYAKIQEINSGEEMIKKLPDASPELTRRVHSVIEDHSVKIKYYKTSEKDKLDFFAGGFINPLTGTKIICINPDYAPKMPDGFFNHEYCHIKKMHRPKQDIIWAMVPLATLATLKSSSYGYKILRHGHAIHTPSVGASLIRFLGTWFCIETACLVNRFAMAPYLQRLYEYEADDAIPASLAEETADYFEKNYLFSDLVREIESSPMERLGERHPPTRKRIPRLRARAAQAKA